MGAALSDHKAGPADLAACRDSSSSGPGEELGIPAGQLLERRRNQTLFHILPGFNHILQMQSGEPGAPWIGQRASALRTQLEQVRMPQRDGFLTSSIVTAQDKLYVHRIAMAQGDGRLEPLELHLPNPPERVRPGFELPEILHDDESLTFWNGCWILNGCCMLD